MISEAFEALFEMAPEEAGEEIDLLLQEEGYDPAQLVARMQILAEQALLASPLNWRNQAQVARNQSRARREAVRSQLPQGREGLLALARQLLGQAQAPMAAHFRNLEASMDDEELASFVCDLVCLDEDGKDRRAGGPPS